MGRRSRSRRPAPHPEHDGFERLLAGWKRTEHRRGADWTVQPIAAGRSEKSYLCPACGRQIPPGDAHVVVWRADGILGDAASLADRRHWHTHCWRDG